MHLNLKHNRILIENRPRRANETSPEVPDVKRGLQYIEKKK